MIKRDEFIPIYPYIIEGQEADDFQTIDLEDEDPTKRMDHLRIMVGI